MSFDDRTKETVRYRIERLRIFAIVALAPQPEEFSICFWEKLLVFASSWQLSGSSFSPCS